jgi:hypothetical protein
MRYREKKFHDEKQDVEGYEHNLHLVLDTYKNELQDINRDRTLQYGNFKTILWINVVFIGVSIKLLEYHPDNIFFILFGISSFVSILIALLGMLEGQFNAYATMGRPSKMASLKNDRWLKSQGLLSAIYAYRQAIKYNGINLIKRSRWLRRSKYLSLLSLFLLLLLGSVILKGENPMSEKPQKPVSTTKSIKRANDSVQPKKPVQPTDSNSSKK